MVDPAPREFTPVWLSPEDVKSWLRLHGQDASDDDLIRAVTAATETYVETCRADQFAADGTFVPDDLVYQGARMYAARAYRRRNSPAGIETFGDTTSFVSRYDPDIDRALQIGSFAGPVIS